MKEFISTLVFVLIALPFIYMAYDVGRDIYQQVKKLITQKTRPLIHTLIQIFVNS